MSDRNRRPRWALLILVNVVLLLLGAIVGEALMRVYLAFNTVYDVEMTRYSNSVKTPSEASVVFEHRPFSVATLMGVDVRINSDGLRDQEYPLEKNGYRMIFLGDSLTFGWGVERPETFEYLLETRFNAQDRGRVEILNFGTGNYNTAQQEALFGKKGLKYRPDKVVVFYFVNDAEPTPTASRWEFLGHSRLVTFYWSRINILRSKYASQSDFQSQYGSLYEEGRPGFEAMKASFLALRERCAANGIALQVVMLPELHNLKNPTFVREYGMVRSFLEREAISVLDLTPQFSTVEDEPTSLWVALDDAHPNAKAHKRIADFTEQFISPWSEQ